MLHSSSVCYIFKNKKQNSDDSELYQNISFQFIGSLKAILKVPTRYDCMSYGDNNNGTL